MNFEFIYLGNLEQDPRIERSYDTIGFFNHLPPEFIEENLAGAFPAGPSQDGYFGVGDSGGGFGY